MRGLLNLGNTCYFNSCIQCLLHTKLLTDVNFTGGEFPDEYTKIAQEYWSEPGGPIDTTYLFNAFTHKFKQFDNKDEQDAQEALVCILDLLHKSSKTDVKSRYFSYDDRTEKSIEEWNRKSGSHIKEIFFGQCEKSVTYSDGKSITWENFGALFLDPLPGKVNYLPELLVSHNRHTMIENYTDNDGKTHRVAALGQRVSYLPPVFTVCFNSYIHKGVIQVPERMVLSGQQYELYACCVHFGNMRGGHYVAFIKHDGKWYIKDDEKIIEQKPNLTNHFYFCMFANSEN